MAVSFKGGITLRGEKGIKSLEVKPLLPCERHIFVLNDHIGAEIFPRVEEGAHVSLGDKLADAEEYTAIPVHSSISGTVEKIEYNENGKAVSISVTNDKLYTMTDNILKNIDYGKLSKLEKLWVIRDAGILDSDSIPAHMKLAPEKDIRYLVINGIETSPGAGAKCRRIIENTEDVMRGIDISMELSNAAKCVIGVDGSMGECINKIKPFIRYSETKQLVSLKPRFPQENKRLVIKTLTGISVGMKEIEYDLGIVCLDIETVYNIGRVFRDGMPVIERIVTAGGSAAQMAENFNAPIGVTADFLFKSCGGFKSAPDAVIAGSIMNGVLLKAERASVTRTTSAFFAEVRPREYDAEACIRCGKCADVCPVGLLPYRLSQYAQKGNFERMMKYHAKDCIECGLCSYICPSRINVLENIKHPLHKNAETEGNKDA